MQNLSYARRTGAWEKKIVSTSGIFSVFHPHSRQKLRAPKITPISLWL